MSIFAVNHLCREVLRDHAFRAAMKADPAKALGPLDLTDEERRLCWPATSARSTGWAPTRS